MSWSLMDLIWALLNGGKAVASNTAYEIVPVVTYEFEEGTWYTDLNENDFSFKLFPNPSSGNINVNFNLISDAVLVIEILDEIGRLVYKAESADYTKGLNGFKMNLSSVVNTGMYFMRLLEVSTDGSLQNLLHEEKIVFVK